MDKLPADIIEEQLTELGHNSDAISKDTVNSERHQEYG